MEELENIEDLEYIQRAIKIYGNLDYTLEECDELWSIRSEWWAANWMNVHSDHLELLYKECQIVLIPLHWMLYTAKERGLSLSILEILDMCWHFSEGGYQEQFLMKINDNRLNPPS